MITAGIDAGSRTAKAALLDTVSGRVLATAWRDQGVDQAAIAAVLLEEVATAAGRARGAIDRVVATGYGRNLVKGAQRTITEITCHAAGVHHLQPQARSLIEIGGQDSKAMRLGEGGRVEDFAMNDRCAAGTGRFIEMLAVRLGTGLDGFAALSAQATAPRTISSMCVVFAESEIVGLLAGGAAPADILAGVQAALADAKYITDEQKDLLKGLDAALKDAAGHPGEASLTETWRRVAQAVAQVEAPASRDHWAERFYQAMVDFKFVPAGRILTGAGSRHDLSMANCYVLRSPEDSRQGIIHTLGEMTEVMARGGGIGIDFSTLRPKGAPVRSLGAEASGPLSFMDVWDAMCRTIMSAGYRRGAMMATLRCDHPDIEAFIDAKREPGRLRMFNLSVLVTDAFMDAVRTDSPWELSFGGTTFKSVRARELWERIMRATYAYAEPGVIFIDRINKKNNLWYCETIHATNPCGEQPLPPYGACLLGSVNLARLIRDPFTAGARLDEERLRQIVPLAVRMMDNAIDVSRFPLPEQKREAQTKRRIGLIYRRHAYLASACYL